MYGTIARMRVLPGKEAELEQVITQGAQDIPGFVFAHVYRLDDDPQDLMLVVGFDGKDTYHTNAQSPEQHEAYEAYRALLEADPEWHDGEIIFSQTTGDRAGV